jgi:hypothetical protein
MLPWWAKMGAKLALSRLPVSYGFWKKLGIFRHGEMMVPDRAISAFEGHIASALERTQLPSGFHSLELGPGDSILTGFVARAHGASVAWLVDAGAFAETDLAACRAIVERLGESGHAVPHISATTPSGAMADANIRYLTDGTRSLKTIPTGSIHYFWSQVVLEHVYRGEFLEMMQELRRVVCEDSIGVHSIDFRDHLGGALNNLRFADKIWEAPGFRDSGFYTNRIRPREMIAMLETAGFDVELVQESRWPGIPTPRSAMAPQFAGLDDEDFLVREVRVVLRPRPANA